MTTAAIENPFAGQGSVLLDIGGDVGALIVTMPGRLAGVEVEIRPAGGPELRQDPHATHPHEHEHGHGHEHAHHPHVAVVARPVGDARVPSLVFPELVEGSYELYEKGTYDVRLLAEILGGEVTTAEWPD